MNKQKLPARRVANKNTKKNPAHAKSDQQAKRQNKKVKRNKAKKSV